MTRAALATLATTAAAACAPALLSPGQVVAGRLARVDPRFADGSHFREFQFRGARGDTITALLQSDDFDPMLVLAVWGGRTLAEDDDGGGDCNARLTLVLPRRGFYSVYVTSSSGSELGAFRLEIRAGTPPPPPADTACRGFGPVAGTVRPGESVMGGLEHGDARFDDSTFLERWTLVVAPGQTFSLDVQSADFDPVLILVRGRGEELASDDDGGPGCGARLTYTAADARPLRVIVTSSDAPPGQTGTYFLHARRDSLPRDAGTDCPFGLGTWSRLRPAGRIDVGARVAGALTTADALLPRDGTYAQWWALTGSAGRTVTIDLLSDEFDAYLMLLGPGIERALEDDDGGGACHARITLAFPRSGEYRIVVNATAPRATGSFVLSVLTSAPPPAAGPCPRG